MCGIPQQVSLGKGSDTHLSITIAAHLEARTQCVDSFHTDPIQSDTLLKRLTVIFTSRIQHTYSLNKFSLRNTPTIVTHTDTEIFFNDNLNLFTRLHFEFIDTVVENFFQKDVDTVLGM